jgi:hypothetical protein
MPVRCGIRWLEMQRSVIRCDGGLDRALFAQDVSQAIVQPREIWLTRDGLPYQGHSQGIVPLLADEHAQAMQSFDMRWRSV